MQFNYAVKATGIAGDDNFTNVDYTIDTDMHTILEVTDEVYSLYNKKLSQLNHKA